MLDIIVPTSECRQWPVEMEYAAALAAQLHAGLTALHVQAPATDLSHIGSASLYAELVDILQDRQEAVRAAADAFAQWARQRNVPRSRWRVTDQGLDAALRDAADCHDLVVLRRPADGAEDLVRDVGRCLLAAPLPILLLPSDASPESARWDTVAIAWNGSRGALRAVHAALPMLRRAQRVELLLDSSAGGVGSDRWRPMERIEGYLTWQDVPNVHVRQLRREDPAHLIEVAAERGANVLVMGAYGSARYLEWLFGGATQRALQQNSTALFLRH